MVTFNPNWQIKTGDCLTVLRTMHERSVNCCITSPPYFGLRDYGCDGQIGLESTPDAFVSKLVEVFREVRRVLRDDGTLWLNLGDSYAGSGKGGNPADSPHTKQRTNVGSVVIGNTAREAAKTKLAGEDLNFGFKPKDLIGIPWRVAFALQADGWYLRQDIIWHKPNPMPESVTDRCTKAHEYLFLLAKSQRYYFDSKAMKEAAVTDDNRRPYGSQGAWELDGRPVETRPNGKLRKQPRFGGMKYGDSDDPKHATKSGNEYKPTGTRNRRSVWTVCTKPFKGAHFATFPPKLIEPCVLAGCPEGGTVLDPFNGAGTTGVVAIQQGRKYIGIELNPEYVAMAETRIRA